MAFVYRTISDGQESRCQTPGPGAYFNPRRGKKHQQEQYRVPFNQSQNRQIWKKTIAPGPGAYQSQSSIKKEKKLASDITGQIAIYQTPSQSMTFKSKTRRFVDNSNLANPGPGSYEAQSLKPKSSSASRLNHRSSGGELKEFLRSKTQTAQGQIVQQQKEIIVNMNGDSRQAEDCDNWRQTDTIKSHKTTGAFASKVQRQVNRIRPKTSLGPGSYNINKSSFKVEKNYQKKTISKSISVEKKFGKAQGEELGPGYYEVDRAFKNLSQGNLIKKKKLECFGSTVDRFQNHQGGGSTVPGPAYYGLQDEEFHFNSLKKQSVKTTFPKQQRILFHRPTSPITPLQYQSGNNLSQTLKQKYKRNPSAKQCFGSTKSRFQQKQQTRIQQQQQQQQSYSLLNLLVIEKENAYKSTGKLQRKSCSNLLRNQNNGSKQYGSVELKQMMADWTMFRPFCYDAQTNTLQAKYNKRIQKKAPFMSYAQRFKNTSSSDKYIDLEPKQKKSPQKQRRNEDNKKARYPKSGDKKLGWMGISKDSRFKYQQQNSALGPQSYNPVKPQKKSYNVLFK